MTRGRRLAVIGPWLLTFGLFAGVLGTVLVLAMVPPFIMDASTVGFIALVSSWALVQGTVGTLIAWRRPENPIGRLMQLTAPLIVAVFAGFLVAAIRYVDYGPSDVIGGIGAWLGLTAIFPMLFLAFPTLGVLFPDGRLPSPAFRWPFAGLGALMVIATAGTALAKGQMNEGLPVNPFGLIDLPAETVGLLSLAGTVAIVGGLVLAVVGVAVRWRRGSVLERVQLKWLLAALGVGAATFGPSFASSETDVFDLLSLTSALLLPVAIGVAVLRYHLYEIDRLISRTVSWTLVTGSLVVVFVVAGLAFQAALAGITQGQTLAVAASTLIAFALFQPLRRLIQAAVDRRFDRARYDAARTADGFAERVRNEVDLSRLRLSLVRTANESVRPGASAVWLRAERGDAS
jgi:hypothetical protein